VSLHRNEQFLIIKLEITISDCYKRRIFSITNIMYVDIQSTNLGPRIYGLWCDVAKVSVCVQVCARACMHMSHIFCDEPYKVEFFLAFMSVLCSYVKLVNSNTFLTIMEEWVVVDCEVPVQQEMLTISTCHI